MVAEQAGSGNPHPNVRLWLIADLLSRSDLRLLYPRKQTYRDQMSAPGTKAAHLQSGNRGTPGRRKFAMRTFFFEPATAPRIGSDVALVASRLLPIGADAYPEIV